MLHCSIGLTFDILYNDLTAFVSIICYFVIYPYFIDNEDIPILINEENTDVSMKLMLVLVFFFVSSICTEKEL